QLPFVISAIPLLNSAESDEFSSSHFTKNCSFGRPQTPDKTIPINTKHLPLNNLRTIQKNRMSAAQQLLPPCHQDDYNSTRLSNRFDSADFCPQAEIRIRLTETLVQQSPGIPSARPAPSL
ncbi:MAG: hypothetical protein ACK5YC_12320, partial [Planctomyces sp.]